MCFSATASFASGIVLTAIGIATVRTTSKSGPLAMLGAIPLLFGAQQITEGFLWLSLTNVSFSMLEIPATWLFLFFAQVIWPAWVPVAAFMAEKQQTRKKILRPLVFIGLLVSAYLLYCLVRYPVYAVIDGNHMVYLQDYPKQFQHAGGFLYLAATLLPTFFSSIKKFWIIGIAILVSYLLSYFFYTEYVVSVWCFFAAIISAALFIVLRDAAKTKDLSHKSGKNNNFRRT